MKQDKEREEYGGRRSRRELGKAKREKGKKEKNCKKVNEKEGKNEEQATYDAVKED